MERIKEFDELRNLKRKLEIEQDRLNKLTESLCLINSSDESAPKVDGGRLNTTEDKFINIADMHHEQRKVVKACEREYWGLENEIFNKIRKVGEKNQTYSYILYARYIDMQTQEQLADNKLHYSVRHVRRLEQAARDNYLKL